MKMAVCWFVAQCSLLEVYRRFRGTNCLHQGDHRTDNSHLCKKFVYMSSEVKTLVVLELSCTLQRASLLRSLQFGTVFQKLSQAAC
jgi:hypothetical protein